jgi:tricorn protease
VSADGSRLAYVKDFQLYTYDVGRGRERKVAVTAPGYEELGQLQDYNTKGKVSAFDVAYDGKKLAFVSRGELFVSDMEGKFIRRLETGPGRVGEVQWLKDDLNLLFNQTVDGYQNWFTVAADGSGAAEQHTKDRQNNRALSISNDSSQAVYLSGRNELRIMDLEEFSSKTIANDEIWAIQNTYPRWSPNDDYIAYNARRDFEMDIFLYDVAAGTSENLTRTGVSEWGPYWSPDGKYLYFYGARHQPGYPRGGGDANVYRLPLQRRAEPLRAEGFRKLFAEDSTKTDSVTHIDRKDIMARIEQVGTSFGDQGSVAVVQEKDKQIVLYGGNQVEGKFQLYQTILEPYESTTTKSIEAKNTGGADDLVMADGKYYLIGDGTVQQLDLDGSKTKAITLDYTFRRRLRPEFEQMFYETWANMEQNFYDTDFHGVDWSALRDAYAEFLPYVNTRADLRRLTNAMLGELNTSHFGFYSSGDEEDVTFGAKSIDLGLTFAPEDPFLIEAIVTEGPADYVDIDLEPGDRLLAIDGQRIDPTRNRESYLSRPSVDGEVELTIDRNGSERTVNLSPASYRSVTGHRYDEWVRENQRRVDERTSENIAYVHMKNMGGGELDNFLNEMVSETYRKNGLILDLRYNTGGNVHDAVLQFLSQRPYLEWKYRGGEPAPQPNFAPAAKPIVLLINEQSLSDAEMTAAGFKQLGLGTVVGMPTYRWIIFTTGQGLVDGSYYRLPSWGCYTLDGRNLEKTGVEPDVRVDNTMLDRLHGRDPQLERAIDEVLRAR